MAGEYTGPKLSGVPVASISAIAGVNKALIRNIGGVATANLGFGPDYYSGPTCEPLTATYSSVSLINAANSQDYITVEFDMDNSVLYAQEDCGGTYADTGFYVIDNGRGLRYYSWNANAQVLIELDPPPTGPTATVAPSFGVSQLVFGESPSITRGTWTGTGNISYTYKFYSDGGLISTQGPFPTTDVKGNVSDPQPYFTQLTSYLFTTIRLEVLATDDIGTTTQYVDIRMTESKLNTFLANSGITDPTRIAALEYLQKALLTSTSQILSQTNLDYYPFAGDSEYQNKWSLGNPSEYLTFYGNWSHDSNGSQAGYGIAQSTRLYTNSFNNIQFAYGMYTNTNNIEDFRDIRLDTGVYGAWDFGANRRVNGSNKVYWTAATTEYTSNDSAGSLGLSGLYRDVQSGTNRVSVISGGSMQTAVLFGGSWPLYINSIFTIGGATKNYQFAFIGNFITAPQVEELNTILQTYNSMLGR